MGPEIGCLLYPARSKAGRLWNDLNIRVCPGSVSKRFSVPGRRPSRRTLGQVAHMTPSFRVAGTRDRQQPIRSGESAVRQSSDGGDSEGFPFAR